VNQEDREQNEVDVMKKGADSTDNRHRALLQLLGKAGKRAMSTTRGDSINK